MTTQLVDGRKIAAEILQDLKNQIQQAGLKPRLAVFLVGDNPASLSYIRIKQKKAKEIGILVDIHRYSVDITAGRLIEEILKANSDSGVHGILVQLPLPKHLNRDEALNAIAPDKDLDCLTEANKIRLNRGEPYFLPPAAAAVMKILEYYDVFPLPRPNVLIVGSGELVGKPLSAILLHKQIPFEIANSQTENLNELAAEADIIITGVGKAELITGEMIKDGAVIIDAGTTGSDSGEITGDVDQKSVMGKASLLAPVPGGVGPVTVAMLLSNVVNSALRTQKEEL